VRLMSSQKMSNLRKRDGEMTFAGKIQSTGRNQLNSSHIIITIPGFDSVGCCPPSLGVTRFNSLSLQSRTRSILILHICAHL